MLSTLRQRLGDVSLWSATAIHNAIEDFADEEGLKLGKIAQPLRVAVSGRAVSPPIDITLELLGRDLSLQRIDRALDYMRNV